MDKRMLIRAAGAALALALLAPAQAQVAAYPDHPIRIVVPYPPGGFNDTLARTVGAKLQSAWGQPVVVENRPGGATNIGIDMVAKAPADGYTLVVLPFSFAVNPFIFAKLPFDPQTDFAPITLAATTSNLLVVPAASPVNSVQELVALAKSKPGSLSYASTGVGSSNHLSMEMFKQMAGVDITHVPYKGSAPAVADLIGGHVGTMFDNVSNVLQHVQSGKLKVLGVTTPARSALVPSVPTVAESGVPGYEVGVWFGFAAPAGTPKPIIDKLNAEIVKILRMADVREKFSLQGVESIGSTPEQFAAHLQAQRAVWSKVVREAGVRAD
ncbi:MAG: tripartite tricarboxylate transporter substrate binding protein [Burkholderiaceae bacterium]|nr:tripartite tricarboxylate transporter substrate binding protein [Rhodoferax sp.]MCB2003908.1 tripartite tricarboxylate transporter substrate binding protein [Rhodoferax sp.]MCP5263720.1 tripartite tricarboxylate transporter substrate binding protein [Rhodoferax sp.]MCW5641072.1 tripartite tricarboxylate transporter substrate binding protein [Rhodoferax sp.]